MIESKKERMITLYYFLFFILGIIFAEYIDPLLDSIWGIIMTRLEIIKGKYGIEVAKINEKINSLSDEAPPQHAIGFIYDEKEEETQGEDEQ